MKQLTEKITIQFIETFKHHFTKSLKLIAVPPSVYSHAYTCIVVPTGTLQQSCNHYLSHGKESKLPAKLPCGAYIYIASRLAFKSMKLSRPWYILWKFIFPDLTRSKIEWGDLSKWLPLTSQLRLMNGWVLFFTQCVSYSGSYLAGCNTLLTGSILVCIQYLTNTVLLKLNFNWKTQWQVWDSLQYLLPKTCTESIWALKLWNNRTFHRISREINCELLSDLS